ncbi:hypothetical protein [Thermococcus sp.]|uniref:hypothetical protein n=1 Tax=Thermococcus sp. TaxID=35749 RepID=UPI002630DFB8|nr:hypothetical protein [Thermococcus sp.]
MVSVKFRGLRPLVSLITVVVVMYAGLKLNLRNVLFVWIADADLFLATSLLNIHRNVFGLSERDIKSRGALISLPYLVVIVTVSFFQCAFCYSLLLLWLFLWYYFKNKCLNLTRKCIMLLYVPTVILALVYRTPFALSYAIITYWLQGEIEAINRENMRRPSGDEDSTHGALSNIPRDAWGWKRNDELMGG